MPANAGFPYDQLYDAVDIVTAPTIPCQLAQTLKVLIIGNSISFHPSLPSIGWLNEWGMAATLERNDYRHITATLLANMVCATVTVKEVSAWLWERDFDTISMSLFQVYRDWLPDIVVFRMGDNIQESDTRFAVLAMHIERLMSYIDNGRGIGKIATRTFYPRPTVTSKIADAAMLYNYAYIDWGDLYSDISNRAISEQPSIDPAVGDHPGDRGMKRIAGAVFPVVAQVARGILKPYPIFSGEGTFV